MPDFIKNLNDSALIGLIGIIIAAMIAFVIYFLQRRDVKKDTILAFELEKSEAIDRKFSEARKEFISTFDDAIKSLYSGKQATGGIIKETIGSHRAAYGQFRSVIKRFRDRETVRRLDKVWNDYNCNGTVPYAQLDKVLTLDKIQAIIDFVNEL